MGGKSSTYRIVVCALVATSLFVGVVPSAIATNTVGNNAECDIHPYGWAPDPESVTPCNADNGYHTFNRSAVGPLTQTAIYNTAFGSWDTISNLTMYETGNRHGITDVYFEFEDLSIYDPPGGGVYAGVYWCGTGNSDDAECDHAHVAFDPNVISGWSSNQLQKIACHELGHSLGLTHPASYNNSTYRCMNTGSASALVGPHNVNHVEQNSHY